MPFRCSLVAHDIFLAKEVAQKKPQNRTDWDEIAKILLPILSSSKQDVKISGRACRERLTLLIEKYEDEDKKALKGEITFRDLNIDFLQVQRWIKKTCLKTGRAQRKTTQNCTSFSKT